MDTIQKLNLKYYKKRFCQKSFQPKNIVHWKNKIAKNTILRLITKNNIVITLNEIN